MRKSSKIDVMNLEKLKHNLKTKEMKIFVENPDLRNGGEQNYSAVAEISFTASELSRVSADYVETDFTGI